MIQTPLYWARCAHGGESLEHLPSLGLCADEFVVRAQGRLAENVGWDALPALPLLRDKVLARVLTDVSKREKLTLYTRGDARRRRFQGNVQNFATRLGATKILARMPRGDPRQQIALYASSDVVVAPFGSNTANSVFMQPGSTFVEVTPLCASTCEEGCHPYSKTLSGNMADYYNISRANACLNLMADGPPLHRYSGVNYHIVPTCSGTLRCSSGKMVEPSGRPVEMRKAWKANFNDDLDVDVALPRVLEILRGRSPQTRVAPFTVGARLSSTSLPPSVQQFHRVSLLFDDARSVVELLHRRHPNVRLVERAAPAHVQLVEARQDRVDVGPLDGAGLDEHGGQVLDARDLRPRALDGRHLPDHFWR